MFMQTYEDHEANAWGTLAVTPPALVMKAFGYAAGDAVVNHSWGLDASEL